MNVLLEVSDLISRRLGHHLDITIIEDREDTVVEVALVHTKTSDTIETISVEVE